MIRFVTFVVDFFREYFFRMLDSLKGIPGYFSTAFGNDSETTKWFWGGIFVGILLMFAACDSKDEDIHLFVGSEKEHRGYIRLVAMLALIDGVSAAYPVLDGYLRKLFHFSGPQLGALSAGIFSPFGILLIVILVTHGMRGATFGTFFLMFSANFLYYISMVVSRHYTAKEWGLIWLESLIIGLLSIIFSFRKYLFTGYICYGFMALIHQNLWSYDGIKDNPSIVYRVKRLFDVDWMKVLFRAQAAEIVLMLSITAALILFELLAVGSIKDYDNGTA